MIGIRLRISRMAILTLNSRNLRSVAKIRAIAVPNRHHDVVALIVARTKIVTRMLISDGSESASLV